MVYEVGGTLAWCLKNFLVTIDKVIFLCYNMYAARKGVNKKKNSKEID